MSSTIGRVVKLHVKTKDGELGDLKWDDLKSFEAQLPDTQTILYEEVEIAWHNLQDLLSMSWRRRFIQRLNNKVAPLRFYVPLWALVARRDAEWEEQERFFHHIAINQVNQQVRVFNDHSKPLEMQELSLDKQLDFMVEGGIERVAKNLVLTDEELSLAQQITLKTPTESVYLPLEQLDMCNVCNGQTSLRLCSSCGEVIYCSKECQREDWLEHKLSCGRTIKIDLRSFYPFIANMIDSLRASKERPLHLAAQATIADSLDLRDGNVSVLPDGSKARIIELGEPCTVSGVKDILGRMRAWWPASDNLLVTQMLNNRIEREGWLAPALAATCFSLLSTIYTSTWVSASQSPTKEDFKRLRFHYRGYPISDFGIVKGAIDVPPLSVRVYVDKSGEQLPSLQDPNDHYWMYFTTLGGEDILLDCGLYSYDHGSQILAEPYQVKDILSHHPFIPARLVDRDNSKYLFKIHKEKKRFSVLRDPDLHKAIKVGTEDPEIFWKFLANVMERECTDMEKYLSRAWIHRACLGLLDIIGKESWTNWPAQPTYIVEDPITAEIKPLEPIKNKKWAKEMMRLSKRHARGEVTMGELAKRITEITNRARKQGHSQV